MINAFNNVQVEQQRLWFHQLIDQNEPVWSQEHQPLFKHLRNHATSEMKKLPVIQRKHEAWRYSNSERLFKNTFYSSIHKMNSIDETVLQPMVSLRNDNLKLVFIDGHFNASLSDMNDIPKGCIISNVHGALESHPAQVVKWIKQIAHHTEHLFTALNTALMNDGVFIYIGKNIEMDRAIEVFYLNSSDKKKPGSNGNNREYNNVINMSTLRNIIVLDTGAKANLIEHYSSHADDEYFNNNVIDIVVNEKANLKHNCIQDESRKAFHLCSLFLSQYKDSQYHGLHLAMGSIWSRAEYNVTFKGTGADCDLKGLFSAGNKQLTDIHIDIKHAVPDCRSREHFKGILYGEGRAVFDGHVVVEKDAQHSDASMTNNNLILSINAEVDTKPHLEIYADDVKCSHGTTVGQLNEEQIFYLRSRGIEEQAAKKLLCMGFANEIIDSIEEKTLRDYVTKKMTETLNIAMSG